MHLLHVVGPQLLAQVTHHLLAHGPLGEAAASAAAFQTLTKDDEFALFQFLRSLGRADFDFNDDDSIEDGDDAATLAHASSA